MRVVRLRDRGAAGSGGRRFSRIPGLRLCACMPFLYSYVYGEKNKRSFIFYIVPWRLRRGSQEHRRSRSPFQNHPTVIPFATSGDFRPPCRDGAIVAPPEHLSDAAAVLTTRARACLCRRVSTPRPRLRADQLPADLTTSSEVLARSARRLRVPKLRKIQAVTYLDQPSAIVLCPGD